MIDTPVEWFLFLVGQFVVYAAAAFLGAFVGNVLARSLILRERKK